METTTSGDVQVFTPIPAKVGGFGLLRQLGRHARNLSAEIDAALEAVDTVEGYRVWVGRLEAENADLRAQNGALAASLESNRAAAARVVVDGRMPGEEA